MSKHVKTMFLHGFDVLQTLWSHEGLPVMCKGLPVMCKGLSVMCHDCNHDSHANTMTSQCECNDVTHMMRT